MKISKEDFNKFLLSARPAVVKPPEIIYWSARYNVNPFAHIPLVRLQTLYLLKALSCQCVQSSLQYSNQLWLLDEVDENDSFCNKRMMDTLSELFWPSSEKGNYTESKGFAPIGTIFFLLSVDLFFPKDLDV